MTSVVVLSVMRLLRRQVRGRADAGPTLLSSTYGCLNSPCSSFCLRIRYTDWSIRDSLISPLLTALIRGVALEAVQPLAAVVRRRLFQLVHAGLDRQHGDPVVAVLGAESRHAEGVGDDDALVVQLVAEDSGEDRLGERRRVQRRVQRGNDDVRRHDRVDAVRDVGLERRQVELLPLLLGVVDDRHTGVAVGVGVTVPREVLGRGDDARRPGSRRPRRRRSGPPATGPTPWSARRSPGWPG